MVSLRFIIRISLLTISLHAWLRGAAPAPSTPPPPTIEQLFGLPDVRQPRLSPDGTKVAFLFPHERRLALGLFDRKSGESQMILRGEDESLVSFFWKGGDRIVFLADVGGNESFFIGSTDLAGRNVLRLAESQRIEDNLVGNVANILDELPADPQRILVAGYFAFKSGASQHVRLFIATGFLGGHLVRELIERGEHVRALARGTSDVRELVELGVFGQSAAHVGEIGDELLPDLVAGGFAVATGEVSDKP